MGATLPDEAVVMITVSTAPDLDPRSAFCWDTGHELVVCSPMTSPDDACPWCVRHRWVTSRPTRERESLLSGTDGLSTGNAGANPWARRAALQIATWLVETAAEDEVRPGGRTVVVSAADLTTRTVTVMRWGSCSAPVHRVGPIEARPGTPREGPTVHAPQETGPASRGAAPADLGLPVDELVDHDLGVLSRSLPESWFHPVSVMAHGVLRERSIFQDHTLEFGMNGHGRSRAESRALALLEGLERHSGLVKRNDGEVLRARLAELPGRALDPALLGIYPAEHFAPDRNRLGHVPWDPDLELEWVRGSSTITGEDVWVPRQMAYYLARGDEPTFVQDNSNGCAVGSTLDECILFGACEVIERDAFLVAWLGRASMPRIDISASRELAEPTRTVLARLDDAGYSTWLFDGRADLPVPVVVAVVVRDEPGPGRFAVGASANLDPAAAVHGALKEAGTNAPLMRRVYEAGRERAEWLRQDPERVEQLEDHGLFHSTAAALDDLRFWLHDQPGRPLRETFEDWTIGPGVQIGDVPPTDVLLGVLNDQGFEPVVVEQTSDETRRCGLRAARTIVPGLLPLDFGPHEMRALSLPRRARLRASPGAELNPLPHPFT